MERKLLVLDLDETLVYADLAPMKDYDFTVSDRSITYWVKKRPHLDAFLESARRHYELAVWSAASEGYVKRVSEKLFSGIPLLFVWSGARCTTCHLYDEWEDEHRTVVLKRLKKIWRRADVPYTRYTTLVLDNTPETYSANYGNAVPIVDFTGRADDRALLDVADLLDRLAHVENVRVVEKRT